MQCIEYFGDSRKCPHALCSHLPSHERQSLSAAYYSKLVLPFLGLYVNGFISFDYFNHHHPKHLEN